MENTLMDDLFERIKVLEEENKLLEKENNNLDNELNKKKAEISSKSFLTEKEKLETEEKNKIFLEKFNALNKLIDENYIFPEEENAAPILKNKNFDETEIMNYLQLLGDEKKRISAERTKALDKVRKSFDTTKAGEDPKLNTLIQEFEKKFKGRIIINKNINYKIKYFDKYEKSIKAMMLYDSNGIKVDEKMNEKMKLYSTIQLKDLFETCYIASKEESDLILKNYNNDNKKYIKILYQLQIDKNYPVEKDIIPYRIEPNYIDINDYNLTIKDNSITHVENKQNRVFVVFDSLLIGDGKGTTGLVSSSSIKVYTTLYSKDILNILHIHLNDTSQEITIDSEFLEKDENVLNHKVFLNDITGKKLTYKLIFKDYKLLNIFYNVSNDFIDEPPFEEIRIKPNNFVKIIKGDYKNYYGQVKDFPIGMLARKDKDLNELKKMKSSGFKKEGYCPDRHLEELPGFVSVIILFDPTPKKMKESVNMGIPVCFLVPLTPEEQIKFEKNIIIEKEMEIEEDINEIEELTKKCEEYETYIKDDKILEEKSLEEVKNILNDVQSINENNLGKNLSQDEYKEKIEFVKNIKKQIEPLLIQKIRLFTLMGKK